MYKTLGVEDLSRIDNTLVKRLGERCHRRRTTIKQLYKQRKTYDKEYCIIHRGGITITIQILPGDQGIMIHDSIDNIHLGVTPSHIGKLDSIIQRTHTPSVHKKHSTQKKSMLEILISEFDNGEYSLLNNKPYLVYDIETLGDIRDKSSLTCEVTYAVISNEYNQDHGEGDAYRYFDSTNVKELVTLMINFDGYIVGYNNIGFDNPVVCTYAGYGEDTIDLLNKKTIDLFLIIRQLTGKRIGLTKVAGALVGLEKTLSSGLEGMSLLMQYKETGKKSLLEKVKKYCKNDVKMTLAVLLYLWKYGAINTDNTTVACSLDDIILYGSHAYAIDTELSESGDLGDTASGLF